MDEGTNTLAAVASNVSPDTIPGELWNVFPPNGSYIRHLLEFCGYQSRNSILQLRNAVEFNSMIDFAKQMHSAISLDERRKIFGIFCDSPEKLCILPGLKETFKSFLAMVEGKTTSSSKSQGKTAKKKVIQEKRESNSPYMTVEKLSVQMDNWCKKRDYNGERRFEIITSHNKFSANCLVCNTPPIDLIGNSLCNFQKHIRETCWLNKEKL